MEDEALGLIFKRLFHSIKKDMDNRMKSWDLTMSQAMVLEYLSNTSEKGLTQKDIEHHFNLQHPTVSGILKRLEKKRVLAHRDMRGRPTGQKHHPDREGRKDRRTCEAPPGTDGGDVCQRVLAG